MPHSLFSSKAFKGYRKNKLSYAKSNELKINMTFVTATDGNHPRNNYGQGTRLQILVFMPKAHPHRIESIEKRAEKL